MCLHFDHTDQLYLHSPELVYKILCNFKIQTDFTFLRFHSKQGDEVMNTQVVKVKETEKTLLMRKRTIKGNRWWWLMLYLDFHPIQARKSGCGKKKTYQIVDFIVLLDQRIENWKKVKICISILTLPGRWISCRM